MDKLDCDKCLATTQMRESHHCTKSVVRHDNSFVPECFIRSKGVSQAERNYLICPTYNLGMYEVCNTCPLDCVKNPNQKTASSPLDIMNLLGMLFNIDDSKKKDISKAIEQLNQPDFQEAYKAIERSSKAVQEVMSGKQGSSDVAKKILEVETGNLKSALEGLVKSGKITEAEISATNKEFNTMANIQNLKTMLNSLKKS